MCELNRSVLWRITLCGPLSSAGRLPLHFTPLVGESLASLAASRVEFSHRSTRKHWTLSNFLPREQPGPRSWFLGFLLPERVEWICCNGFGSAKLQTERISRISPQQSSTACGGCFDAHNEVTSDTVDECRRSPHGKPRVNAQIQLPCGVLIQCFSSNQRHYENVFERPFQVSDFSAEHIIKLCIAFTDVHDRPGSNCLAAGLTWG